MAHRRGPPGGLWVLFRTVPLSVGHKVGHKRLSMLTASGGTLSVIAMPAITAFPMTFEGQVDGMWFLQVTDSDSPNLAAFAGLETYDINPGWVINAIYRSRAGADRETLAGRLGSDEQHQRSSPGDVELTLGGQGNHLAV